MNWKKLWWLFPVAAMVAVFVGYSLFPLRTLTPEMSAEVAVATGLRPAETMFPGLWRYPAALLPSSAAAFGLVGRLMAAFFAGFLYLVIRRSLLMLERTSGDTLRLRTFFIPSIALICAVMGTFAEPIWRAFALFSPGGLTLLFLAASACIYLEWIDKGGWWRLCGGLFLTGVFAAETPLALILPVLWLSIFRRVWGSVHSGDFRPRLDLPMFFQLPMWRMFLSFLAGLLLGGFANISFISARNIDVTLGMKFTYILFHYWQEYLLQIKEASTAAGWLLGVSLCVIPFLMVSRLVPRLTDDDRPMSFPLGVSALFCGAIGYFEQGPLRGAWFWTWIGEKDLVSSVALLGCFSLLATCTFAYVALVFVADAYNDRRSEERSIGVSLSYRYAMTIIAVAVALLIAFRLPHRNVRRILDFNDSAIKETVRELNGAKFVFTDGSADAELELEAARIGQPLYAINLMAGSAKSDEAMRMRGLVEEGDILAAQLGASALLRVWAGDKPNGLDNVALQVGFEYWKREKQLTPPVASAFVARMKGLRDEDIRDASVIAGEFARQITALSPVADATDVPPSVRQLFFALSWRISRMARYRKDAELANRLDATNSALKQMLRDFEYARMQVFLQMTPKEGLDLALKRAQFQDAARYAAAVLKIDEDDPKGNFGMGMYFLMANRFKDAEPYLRRVLVRRPDEPAALNNLSIICRKLRRYDEAVELAKRALDLLPGNEDVKQTLKDAEEKAP